MRKQGSLLQAREKLLDCSQSSCPRLIVDDCTGWLSEVESSLSSLVFAVRDEQGHDVSGARVSGNRHLIIEHADSRPISLDPGTYDFVFEVAGYENATESVAVRQSEKDRIVRVVMRHVLLQAPASAESAPPMVERKHAREPKADSTAIYLLGGTGLLGAGTFAFFGLHGSAKLREVERCTSDCSSASFTGNRDYLLADIGLVVAVATIPILVYLLIDSARGDSSRSDQSVQLRAFAAAGGANLNWSARF